MSLLDPVPGFRFSATAAGLKTEGLDLGLIASARPASAAGVYTKNQLRAPPVDLMEDRVGTGRLQAVLVNSGNANAATGADGMAAARSTTAALAGRLGIPDELVAPASTGVIGVPLRVDRVVGALDRLVAGLDAGAIEPFAQAILTTDRSPKIARRTFAHGSSQASMLAVAKGAGMIHPDMATTLAFVVCDAAVTPGFLQSALRIAAERTFNRITVDGDTSTNDCIVALASGATAGPTLDARQAGAAALEEALTAALDEVALMIVADGEGARHAVRIVVEGAASDEAAVQVARTIATSNLVKTALHGQDPNWGRILAAAGRSGIALDPGAATILIGAVPVYTRGQTMDAATEAAAAEVMCEPRYEIVVRLGRGEGHGWYWTCDLGHDYVTINADYRT